MRVIGLALAAACVVAVPRITTAQLPPPDVTVADARSNGGLSLTIFTASSLGSGFTPSVLIGVEVHGLAENAPSQPNLARQLELDYLAESGGSVLAHHAVAVPLTDDGARQAAGQGLRVLTRMSLAAGRYELRVTARDAGGGGRTVSVVHELNVPNLVGDLVTMSDLLISSSRAGGVTHPEPEDDSLLPLVGRPPTGRRQFSHAEQLEVNAEIYEAPSEDGLGNQLSITTSLLTPDGRVVREAVESGASETLPNGVFGYQHYTLVPIGTLSPGLYILRVSVSVDGVASAAFRAVPITVTAP